jgi:hypothetical protein
LFDDGVPEGNHGRGKNAEVFFCLLHRRIVMDFKNKPKISSILGLLQIGSIPRKKPLHSSLNLHCSAVLLFAAGNFPYFFGSEGFRLIKELKFLHSFKKKCKVS